jgi:hypothetical protein
MGMMGGCWSKHIGIVISKKVSVRTSRSSEQSSGPRRISFLTRAEKCTCQDIARSELLIGSEWRRWFADCNMLISAIIRSSDKKTEEKQRWSIGLVSLFPGSHEGSLRGYC